MFEGSFAEIRLGKGTPHLHLGDVRDVLRDDDRFLDLLIFGHESVQEIRFPIRVHDLPMWIGRLRWDEVIGERERALTVCRRVRDEAFVCFCALERSTLVAVLGKAARCSQDQRGEGSEYRFIIHVVSLVLFATGLFPPAFHPIRRRNAGILTAVAGIA